MREDNKRWLMSVMKTSGSERKHVINGNFSETRNSKKELSIEDLPQSESFKSTMKFYNGKINYGLLVRFLRGKVGSDWDDVYSEIISRIPTKLMDYKEMIFWFVADKVEFKNDRIWNKKTQQYLWNGELLGQVYHEKKSDNPEMIEFFVNPETNKLERIEQKSFKKINK